MRVAIVDLGKTNAKVALVDTDRAEELAVRSAPVSPRADGPYPHLDVRALWEAIADGLSALAAEGPVDAVGVCAHGATVALLDAEGDLAVPVLDYEHDGPDELADEYDRLRPAFEESGSPRLPGGLNVGAQLLWQERRFPEAFARTASIVTWPQYWAHRLCGEPCCELSSLGAHTDLLDVGAMRPSSLAVARGWDRLLAPVRRPGERLGGVTEAVARATGLAPGTPVHVGIHDSNASLVPHLLAGERPMSVVSTGTWTIAMALGGRDVRLDPARDTLVNVDAFGRAVPSARFMGGRERELLSRSGSGAGADPARAREALGRVLERDARVLPGAVAGCGPWPGRTAPEWSVDEASLDDEEHAVAIGLALGLVAATCLELIGADGPTVLEGPMARDAAATAILRAATGRSVRSGGGATGTAVGAAMTIAASPKVEATEANPATIAGREAATDEALARYVRRWRAAIGETVIGDGADRAR